eukprot:TRINITY_DN15986_c0_g1_i1.p1 TRINITY_DN15986_c0_g1~~TRINITY_DN15986_c0_g1_i1.p1  ORF type:complete len:220 (+),score=-22.13 TRINITY_DN15986_c0_g1_i1:421-1080(+)
MHSYINPTCEQIFIHITKKSDAITSNLKRQKMLSFTTCLEIVVYSSKDTIYILFLISNQSIFVFCCFLNIQPQNLQYQKMLVFQTKKLSLILFLSFIKYIVYFQFPISHQSIFFCIINLKIVSTKKPLYQNRLVIKKLSIFLLSFINCIVYFQFPILHQFMYFFFVIYDEKKMLAYLSFSTQQNYTPLNSGNQKSLLYPFHLSNITCLLISHIAFIILT